jgi:hypothetical protein
MEYRLDKNQLLETLGEWNRFLKRKVHLIACGGTAMTLLGIKPSTKDVDFMTPDVREYNYLTGQLQQLGYHQITGSGWRRKGEIFHFDLFAGNRIHTTELIESPLAAGRNTRMAEYSHLYIGILNDEDLICSKLMRGTRVDFDDCLMLARAHAQSLNPERLRQHYQALISYDVAQERLRPNIDHFLELLNQRERHD